MAAIKKLKLTHPPSLADPGTQGRVHRARWEAETDEDVPGDFVLVLAQELVGTLPSNSDEVPNKGHRLLWDSGKLKEDIYAAGPGGITAFKAAFPNGYADGGSYALDFEVNPLRGSCGRDWEIFVTWRAPIPGQNESPSQLRQIVLAGQGDPAPGITAPPNMDGDGVEKWLEFRDITTQETGGYEVTGTDENPVIRDQFGYRWVMPNGEELPPFDMTRTLCVVCAGYNVPNPGAVGIRNLDFEGTTNAQQINFGGIIAPRYTCRYEQTICSRVATRDDSQFYRATTRILLGRTTTILRVQSLGAWFKDEFGNTFKPEDNSGIPFDRIPLRADGNAALDESEHHFTRLSRQRPVSYAPWAFTSWDTR